MSSIRFENQLDVTGHRIATASSHRAGVRSIDGPVTTTCVGPVSTTCVGSGSTRCDGSGSTTHVGVGLSGRVARRAAFGLAFLGVTLFSVGTAAAAEPPQAVAAADQVATTATSVIPAGDDSPTSGTAVSVPAGLKPLLKSGGNPTSIEQLRLLENQQQRVSESARNCTVSVRIGPAQGCGVIITDTGYVLTAAHVAMRPGKRAEILLSDGRSVRGTTLGMNRHVDGGLIRINPGQNEDQPWPHATLGSSADLAVGMWCVATGHPGGYDQERGPVTRVGRILQVREGAITTDCALIGGDSGGPLFDLEGKLIAVHSRIGNDVADNLHVPVDHYDSSWDRLANGEAWGYLPGFRPVLGVTGQPDLDEARIEQVRPGSPAESAGLQPEDVVVRFGDTPITNFESLRAAVADTMPGERLALLIRRDDQRLRVDVEIGRADD